MPALPDLLFVYGTLRPTLATGWPKQLVGDLEPVATATVEGLLYDLGDYPGMVAGPGIVHGELLRVTAADRLAAIDAYEECGGPAALFRRELVEATLPDRTLTRAWAYFLNGYVNRATLIPHGDYGRFKRGE